MLDKNTWNHLTICKLFVLSYLKLIVYLRLLSLVIWNHINYSQIIDVR